MRRYNRNEPFRYSFSEPIYCYYKVGNNKTELCDGEILDLSPNGLKIKTSVDLPLETEIFISFSLNSTLIDVTGTIRWKKDFSSYIEKGIQLQNDDVLQRRVINELKQYVKREGGQGFYN